MKVTLLLLEHQESGTFGALPLGSEDYFDPFWDGNSGIFHDVFEHYFENVHPYFRNEAAFNLGGEIAATGHCAYYMYNGFGRRSVGGDWMSDTNLVSVITGQMVDVVLYDYDTFGERVISNVPYQKSCPHTLENIIRKYFYIVRNKTAGLASKHFNVQDVKNLFRWGWRHAERIAPHGTQNVLLDFIAYWDSFCKDYSAEEVCRIFDRLEFSIVTGKNLRWNAKFRYKHEYNKWVNYKSAGRYIQ